MGILNFWSSRDRENWYGFSIDAGREYLAVQRDELNGIRNRSITILGLVAAACAVLLTAVLDSSGLARNGWFYTLCVLGTLSFGVSATCVTLIANPGLSYKPALYPDHLLSYMKNPMNKDARETANPYVKNVSLTSEDAKLALCMAIDEMLILNEASLSKVRSRYRVCLFFCFLSLVLWSALAWVFA
ncbi:hypothetical protein [Leucobacter luti]|uniref:hypothetical protein n=1 Tax=Leucobacter luti TaxID=340320 RepID=UPI001C6909DB|nr:hypothetical protein [Leucobacter luti]QYM75600.1 hypothetical protein K1X41_13415 [Leucobacter luti]